MFKKGIMQRIYPIKVTRYNSFGQDIYHKKQKTNEKYPVIFFLLTIKTNIKTTVRQLEILIYLYFYFLKKATLYLPLRRPF